MTRANFSIVPGGEGEDDFKEWKNHSRNNFKSKGRGEGSGRPLEAGISRGRIDAALGVKIEKESTLTLFNEFECVKGISPQKPTATGRYPQWWKREGVFTIQLY